MPKPTGKVWKTGALAVVVALVSLFFIGGEAEAGYRHDRGDYWERIKQEREARHVKKVCREIKRLYRELPFKAELPSFCTGTTPPAPAAPSVTLSAVPDEIEAEEGSVLSWSSTNATSCTASGAWSGAKTLSGTATVTPTSTSSYTLACTGAGGTDTETVTVSVEEAEEPAPEAPAVTLSATPATLEEGESSLLSWSSLNATSCTASGAWSGAQALSGTASVTPSATATYTLTCSGAGGSDAESATVTVEEPEPPVSDVGHVLISEVYYKPDSAHGGSAHEWVELYNPTGASVDLAGWKIADAIASDTLPAGTTIPGHGFLLLLATTTTSAFWTFPSGMPVVSLGSAIGGGLNNTGSETVALMDADGAPIDALYIASSTAPFSVGHAPDAGALFRTSLLVDTDTAVDWTSTLNPTPGL